jgi:hypothetical protein
MYYKSFKTKASYYIWIYNYQSAPLVCCSYIQNIPEINAVKWWVSAVAHKKKVQKFFGRQLEPI